MSGQKPWCFWSTQESIEKEVPSVTAILETIIAVLLCWWIALQVGVVLPLLIGAAVAPLVLLRSAPAVALGLQWFLRIPWLTTERTEHSPYPRTNWVILGTGTGLVLNMVLTLSMALSSEHSIFFLVSLTPPDFFVHDNPGSIRFFILCSHPSINRFGPTVSQLGSPSLSIP